MKALDLFINNKCNLNCSYCTVDNSINKNYDFEKIKEINFKNFDVINILGGEPTMHPNFIEIVKFIYNQNKNIVIFSNGFFYKKLLEIDNLNLKFFITFHYNKRNKFEMYKKIYDINFKTFTEYHIILHKDNFKLLSYFNKLVLKEKPIFTLNNYYEQLDFQKILKLQKKFKNLNFQKIFKLFNKNSEYLTELYGWTEYLYQEDCDRSICTLKDHFLKGCK